MNSNKATQILLSDYEEPAFWVEEKGDDWIVYPWEQDNSEEIQDYLKESK